MGKWNISTSDTLAALMNSDDGEWEAEKVNESNKIRDGFPLLTNKCVERCFLKAHIHLFLLGLLSFRVHLL